MPHLFGVSKYFYSNLVYYFNMNSFSKNLELLMQEKAVSQSQLAGILNVKQQTISRYIKGEREPSFDIVIEIAKYFNLTVGQLLGTEE